MKPRMDLLVLDAHGVVLNAYWPRFLCEIAQRTGEPVERVVDRWHVHVREDAWLGRINDEELWGRLVPACAGRHDWQAVLEAGYTLGPASAYLQRWTAHLPIWLLSNHRSHWLLPRLERFNLMGCFERILVSDAIGAAKPEPKAFDDILKYGPPSQRILFVDDQACNVAAARQRSIRALQTDAGRAWVDTVDNLIGAVSITKSAGIVARH